MPAWPPCLPPMSCWPSKSFALAIRELRLSADLEAGDRPALCGHRRWSFACVTAYQGCVSASLCPHYAALVQPGAKIRFLFQENRQFAIDRLLRCPTGHRRVRDQLNSQALLIQMPGHDCRPGFVRRSAFADGIGIADSDVTNPIVFFCANARHGQQDNQTH